MMVAWSQSVVPCGYYVSCLAAERGRLQQLRQLPGCSGELMTLMTGRSELNVITD